MIRFKTRLPELLRKTIAPAACVAGSLLAASPAMAASLGDIFYIDMENHNFMQPSSQTSPQAIFGNPAAPFQNSLLNGTNPISSQVSYATNYTNAGVGIHPSEPNYVWQEAGLTGPLNDNPPYPSNIVNAPNLSALLQNAGIPWKSYQEDIDLTRNAQGQLTNTVLPQSQWTVPLNPINGTNTAGTYTNTYNGSHQYDFAPRHDGSLFFTATNGGNDTTPANPEARFYAPLQQLSTDLINNTVARYNLITPDLFNDSHTALTGGFTYNGVHYTGAPAAIAQGDNFLSIIVPQIMSSQAYKNNGAIVIWWDESEGGDDSSRTLEEIVISPLAKGNDFISTLPYTHSSDLKSLQQVFGVYTTTGNGYLGDAGSPRTNDLSDLFEVGVIAAAVPEPASFVLMGFGLAGVVVLGRRAARKFA